MKPKILLLVLLTSALTLTGAGCFGGNSTEETPQRPGGVYRSRDRGANWQQISRFDGGGDISRANPVKTIIDRFDPGKIYMAAGSSGLLKFDAGLSKWTRIITPTASVNGIVIHPNNPNIIYIFGNPLLNSKRSKIWKTYDAGATWQEIYTEPAAIKTGGINFIRRKATPTAITGLEINPARPQVMFAGSTAGTLLSSIDGGTTWSKIRTFEQGITGIKPSPDGSRWFILLQNGRLVRTDDDGQTVVTLNVGEGQTNTSAVLQSLQFDIQNGVSQLIAGTDRGLFRSIDNGENWISVALPVSDRQAVSVNAVSVFGPMIYAGSGYVFYSSIDGGQRWKVFQFPITNLMRSLVIDPTNPNVVYAVFNPS